MNATTNFPSTVIDGYTSDCQLGNEGDTRGYVAKAPVEVLESQYRQGTVYFLVRTLDKEMLCLATSGSDTGASYNSTNGRTYGADAKEWTGITTFEQAKKSLGF